MARIRSVHPGLWTDEEFVSCSPLARLLLIGLWNEADDQGVFEWKPVSLKMRLMPMDSVDVGELLAELVGVRAVAPFKYEDKKFGAIRNFRKYQRPKSPNAIHPLPAEFRNYVGLSDAIGEIGGDEPTPIPPKGENPPQMEDGGKEKEEDGKESPPNPPAGGDPDPVSSDDVREAFDAYNLTAESLGLPKARDLTPERRRRIRSRLAASGGIETWQEALGKIRSSPFLTGRTDRAFRADLDFLCQAKSFQRLIEGYYGANGQAPPNGSAVTDGERAEIERRLYG